MGLKTYLFCGMHPTGVWGGFRIKAQSLKKAVSDGDSEFIRRYGAVPVQRSVSEVN